MICHLSNPEIRSHLKLDSGRLFSFLKKMLGDSSAKMNYLDYAPWNKLIINDFKQRGDLDFYIVASHSGMVKRKQCYVEDGIHYTFISYKVAGFIKRLVGYNKVWKRVNPFSKRVKRVIDKINPDIVVLMGTENPYYSCTVLGIENFPVYVLCQTVYNNPSRKDYGMWDNEASETEMSIFGEHRYFGVYCKMHYDLVRLYNPQSIIFKFGYPSTAKLLEPTETKKEYDFVNFAVMMDSRKGFPDSIRALSIVKNKYPNVRLNLIGTCSDEKKQELNKLIEELGLSNNVVFTPFFENQNDLFLHIQKSRFAVLPCKMDNTAGTMLQSMQLGLPIVVYETSGTPSFNREKQCALIAQNGDVGDLAAKMLMLMDDPELSETLRVNAREYQENRAEYNSHNGERLVANFKAIVANYREGTPVPMEQLFNPEIDL